MREVFCKIWESEEDRARLEPDKEETEAGRGEGDEPVGTLGGRTAATALQLRTPVSSTINCGRHSIELVRPSSLLDV